MKQQDRVKQIERFLIVKKANNLKLKEKKNDESLELRQKELQTIVNMNYHKVYDGFEIRPLEKQLNEAEEFLQRFLKSEGTNTIIPVPQQLKQHTHQKTQKSSDKSTYTFRLPLLQQQYTSSDTQCQAILSDCTTIRRYHDINILRSIKQLKKQNRRCQRGNVQSLTQMSNKLHTIQHTNFLNNDLILL